MNTFIVEYKRGSGVTSLYIEDERSIEQLTQHLESGFSQMADFRILGGQNVLVKWDSIIAIYEDNNNTEEK
ncbi:MAG: hypothetical protein RR841_06980 [Eubacterium sp.]